MTNPITRLGISPHSHRRQRGINQGYTVPGCDPTLPATIDTTYNLPLGSTFNPADSAAFQTALNNSVGGDVIVLAAGTVYTGPFTLPVKAGSSWIYVISSALASLPAAGTRVGPSNVGNMPTLRMPSGNSIFDTNGTAPHHYRFVGIHCDVLSSVLDTFGRGAIQIGDNSATTAAANPSYIWFDRCYMHGRDGTGPSDGLSMTRFLALHGTYLAIFDSYVSQVHAVGADSQAVWICNGPGPYKIHNNHLEAAGENFMIGGADPAAIVMLPQDITFTRNYCFKPLAWVALGWSVKNLFELKLGIRVLVEGCVFKNCWVAGQQGPGAVIWSVNQGGTAPWAETRDVWIRKCKWSSIPVGFQLTYAGGEVDPNNKGVPMTRVRIEHIVMDQFGDIGAQGGYTGRPFQINGVGCLQLLHNTIGINGTQIQTQNYFYSNVSPNFTNKNSIYGISNFGIFGDGGTEGTTAYNAFTTNPNVHRNLFTGDASGSYPADNFFPANHAAIGFVDEAGGDYHLSGGSAYKNQADDGTDPGADIDAVNTAIAGVVD